MRVDRLYASNGGVTQTSQHRVSATFTSAIFRAKMGYSVEWESAKWESAKWDLAKWDSAKGDSAKWDSANWEDTVQVLGLGYQKSAAHPHADIYFLI